MSSIEFLSCSCCPESRLSRDLLGSHLFVPSDVTFTVYKYGNDAYTDVASFPGRPGNEASADASARVRAIIARYDL